MTIRVSPITESDLPRVGEFLHRAHQQRRLPAAAWAAAARTPWSGDPPNHGFMLLADEAVVGVYLAFYSERTIDGRLERFCDLGTWNVLPEHRLHSLRLLNALLAQDGYHFTDLSPTGGVERLNARLRFRPLDTTAAVIPNLPWPPWPGEGTVSSDPAVLERTLSGPERELYRDHARCLGARHLVLLDGDRWCYVALRRERWRGLPILASILHVSDQATFRRMIRPLCRHLLVRHRTLLCLAELRVVGARPRPSVLRRERGPKMFRSARLVPEQIDYLYSELACLP